MVTKGEKPGKKRSKRKRPGKKKKPSFSVLNLGHKKRVKDRWRRPRGTANKQRRKNKFAPALPNIGYKNPEKIRGMRSDGMREILVRGVPDIESIKAMSDADREGLLIKFSSAIGKKKRAEMASVAKELGVKVVNFKTR